MPHLPKVSASKIPPTLIWIECSERKWPTLLKDKNKKLLSKYDKLKTMYFQRASLI